MVGTCVPRLTAYTYANARANISKMSEIFAILESVCVHYRDIVTAPAADRRSRIIIN